MEEQKKPYLARLLAAIGLIAAVVIIFVAIGSATSDEEEPNRPTQNPNRQVTQPKTKKKTYEVQEGDNLTVISQKTGIPVDRIRRLNPSLDPQALQPGQKLKLR